MPFSRTSNESNFRTSAYEAVTSYVTQAPADAIPVVQQITVTVLSRMEQLLHMQNQLLGVDDRNNWNELQGNLCSVVIVSDPIYYQPNSLLNQVCRALFVSWKMALSPWLIRL